MLGRRPGKGLLFVERKMTLRFGDLKVVCCPYCGSASFKKDGSRCRKQRYRCKGCGRTFTALAGTFLSDTEKSEAAWKKRVLSLTNELTIKADSEIGGMNRNIAYLWRMKLFACLSSYERGQVLEGKVWFEEIYFAVSEKDTVLNQKGGKPHGISRNLIAVEAAVDSAGRCLAVVLGKGKPTEDQIYDPLCGHIRKGSLLVHDLFHGHAKLVRALGGKEAAVNSADPEALWTLQRIGSFCSLLRRVISLHMGERRENLQCYLDWACLRRYANTLRPKERKKFMLDFCVSTGIGYKKTRKKRPGKVG